MDNKCVCCGTLIPEGRQICPVCDEAMKTDSFTVDDRIDQAYRQGYANGTKELAEVKRLLASAYEVIKACGSCRATCINCYHDSTGCARESGFKWLYMDRVEKIIGGADSV